MGRADTPFSHQERIFEAAGLDACVEDALASAGLSIDDLVYENSKTLKWTGGCPVYISSFPRAADGIPLVSFFTGCGGMDLGFEAVGFEQRASFEISETFCNTLRLNRPDWRVFGPPSHSGDVSDLDSVSTTLLPLVDVPFDGVFIGGPPCQPFSIASNQRFAKAGPNFKRVGFKHEGNGSLIFNFVDLIAKFQPAVFVIENVPGLRDIDGGRQLAAAIDRLRQCGYAIADAAVYDASEYGVPQYRRRMIVIGSRVSGALSLAQRRRARAACWPDVSRNPHPITRRAITRCGPSDATCGLAMASAITWAGLIVWIQRAPPRPSSPVARRGEGARTCIRRFPER